MTDADVGRSPRFFTPEHFSPRAGDGSKMEQTAGGLKRAASQMTEDEQNDRVRKILSLVKVFLTGTPPHRSPSTPCRAPRRVPSTSTGKSRGDAPAAWRDPTNPPSTLRRLTRSARGKCARFFRRFLRHFSQTGDLWFSGRERTHLPFPQTDASRNPSRWFSPSSRSQEDQG